MRIKVCLQCEVIVHNICPADLECKSVPIGEIYVWIFVEICYIVAGFEPQSCDFVKLLHVAFLSQQAQYKIHSQ